MLSKISQTQETTRCMIPFIYVQERQICRDRKSIMVARGWGWEWGFTGDGHQGSCWGDANVLKLDVVMAAQIDPFTKTH